MGIVECWLPTGQLTTTPLLSSTIGVAVAQADAGADVCAPSGMMDGQVASIRRALDDGGHQQTAILAYSAKYASAPVSYTHLRAHETDS